MIEGKVPLPSFATKACNRPMQLSMQLKFTPICNYTDHTFGRNYSSYVANTLPVNSGKQTQIITKGTSVIAENRFTSVYWINLDRHVEQRERMDVYLTNILKIPHKRVRAFDSSNITIRGEILKPKDSYYIPDDVLEKWQTKSCLMSSSSKSTVASSFSSKESTIRKEKGKDNFETVSLAAAVRNVHISGLCGRGNGQNSISDLDITLSHLLAIWEAIFANITSSKYFKTFLYVHSF